jgi:Lipid A disaccharide synthetase
MYGAQLIEALRRRDPSLTFFGAGGERMRAAGCEIVVDAKELAVVGITEILSRLPQILGLYRKLIRAADEKRPAIAIVIDSPAFNWRVARQMHKRGIPVVYYVCPQFWAWRQGRVKLLRKYVDKALVIFPFEEKFYRDRGVDAIFVGHPLADLPLPNISRADYAAANQLDVAKNWITLMPGSRRKEVRMNLPTILEGAGRMQMATRAGEPEREGPRHRGSSPNSSEAKYEFLMPVARTLEASFLEHLMAAQEAAMSLRNSVHLVPEALPALYHSRSGIVASGTATVEAALMGTPFVMVYRVSPLTYALGKPRVKVPYFAMVNLIAQEEVVPELVQDKFTVENIASEMEKIISDGEPRTRMIERLSAVRARLRLANGAVHPRRSGSGDNLQDGAEPFQGLRLPSSHVCTFFATNFLTLVGTASFAGKLTSYEV